MRTNKPILTFVQIRFGVTLGQLIQQEIRFFFLYSPRSVYSTLSNDVEVVIVCGKKSMRFPWNVYRNVFLNRFIDGCVTGR